mmetsp:Transcript_29806/g.79244  ORF Transcript_29806/g.79244 Transcript_29806/m.79244 type:complete len:85 (+) Transcript_29806:1575-1829(+)
MSPRGQITGRKNCGISRNFSKRIRCCPFLPSQIKGDGCHGAGQVSTAFFCKPRGRPPQGCEAFLPKACGLDARCCPAQLCVFWL